MPEEIKPEIPVVVVNETPRTKEDWDKLAKENPSRFAELSQPRIDELTRKQREAKEELERERQEKENLLAEIERLKQPVFNQDQPKKYGNGVYPQTSEEWDTLFLETPTFANDLRNEFIGKQNKVQHDYVEGRKNSAKIVQEEHPDMYITELAEDGTPKKDEKGNFVLKLDKSGSPIFDPHSEKGKLWTDIFYEDERAWSSKNAPTLLMAEMERRLREKGKNMINNAQNNIENDESGLAPKGVTPPKKSSLKFASEEERNLAQKSVGRGTYKSLEEYVEWRDRGALASFDHPNSRPDFQKR